MHKCRIYGPDKLNLWPFYNLTFKCDLVLQSNWTNVSNGTSIPDGEQLCHIILKSMHKCWHNGPDKLNLLPFYHLTFNCDLELQPSWTNVSNGTATPREEQLSQIILKSMHKCRSYSPDKLILLPFYHLTFKCDLDIQPIWTNVSKGTATPQGEQLSQIILKSMHKCRRYGWDKLNICDLQVWHWPSTYIKCFKWHFSAARRQLCQIILKSMHKCRSYGLDKSGLMQHARTYARTPNKNCNSYALLYCKWARQKLYVVEHLNTSYFFNLIIWEKEVLSMHWSTCRPQCFFNNGGMF